MRSRSTRAPPSSMAKSTRTTLSKALSIFSHRQAALTNHDPVNGPSAVFIDTYTNHVTGTLAVELTPSTDPADYPLVLADTANLRGTLFAAYRPGIYGGHLVYEDVIDANFRNGLYDQVLDNSALLADAGALRRRRQCPSRRRPPGLFGGTGSHRHPGERRRSSRYALPGELGAGSFFGRRRPASLRLNNADYAQALNALAAPNSPSSTSRSCGPRGSSTAPHRPDGLRRELGGERQRARGQTLLRSRQDAGVGEDPRLVERQWRRCQRAGLRRIPDGHLWRRRLCVHQPLVRRPRRRVLHVRHGL